MSQERKYIILNNWIPVKNECGSVELFTADEVREEVENGNYIQIYEPADIDKID